MQRWIRKETLLDFFICVSIFLFTFHRVSPDFSPGLDSSYAWAINYLFEKDFASLIQLLFPVGPLGFLVFPVALGNNLLIAILFYTAVKLLFIWLFLKLCKLTDPHSTAFNVLLTLGVSYFLNIEFALLGICAISLLLHIKNKSNTYFLLACFIAALSLFIKSAIGIKAFSEIFLFLIFDFYFARSAVKTLKQIGLLTAIFLLSGFIVFHNLGILFKYSFNIIRFGSGYSSALALFPDNNWYVLGGFLLAILLFPFIVKDKNARLAYGILSFALFAMWKYAMGREDIPHNSTLLYFLFTFWGIIIANTANKNKIFFLLPALSILLYYANMSVVPGFSGHYIEISGINNFKEAVVNYKDYNIANSTISFNAIQSKKLEERTRSKIGNATIDIYPWELTYVPANNLNWKPRNSLQSMGFTHWLDTASAISYKSQNAAEYILFHLEKDRWGSRLGAVDNRHLFNDEPITIRTMMANYSIIDKSNEFLLLHKSEPLEISPQFSNRQALDWNKWILVPDHNDGLLTLGLTHHKALASTLKTILYKDDAYYIDYQLEDDRILTYRFIMANAMDGLWINPFIEHPENNEKEPLVKRIRIRTSSNSLFQGSLQLQWKKFRFLKKLPGGQHAVITPEAIFNKTKMPDTSRNQKYMYTFENHHEMGQDSIPAYAGKSSLFVPGHGYSTAFSLSLDSLWKTFSEDELFVEADTKCYVEKDAAASLVLTVRGSSQDIWERFPMTNDLREADWMYGYTTTTLNRKKHPTGKLEVYVWNTDPNIIYVDDLSLIIRPQ